MLYDIQYVPGTTKPLSRLHHHKPSYYYVSRIPQSGLIYIAGGRRSFGRLLTYDSLHHMQVLFEIYTTTQRKLYTKKFNLTNSYFIRCDKMTKTIIFDIMLMI